MKKINLLTLVLLLFAAPIVAQRNFFQPVNPGQLPQARGVTQQVKKRGIFRLDERGMRTYLQAAPMEFKNNGTALPLEVPLPNGKTEIFNIVESPVLSPSIAAQNPDIKTYTGNGQRDKKSVIRLSLTSSGFSAIILNVDGDAVYFESYTKSPSSIYYNYFVRDIVAPKGGLNRSSCSLGSDQNDSKKEMELLKKKIASNRGSSLASTGSTLTTYRLAMPADAEFVAQNGGSVASGFNAVVAYVNRIVAFYRNELSVTFTLVSGTNMIYTNAATDPYTNDDQVAMLDENQANCDAILGNANYDIGHVWGYVGSSGGGIASRPSVCDNSSKAQGVSGEGDLSTYSQAFMDQLVFHEMGHQFSMSHSYNSSIPVCTTRFPATSVEPGSGATIMSYGFTCSDNTGNDDYPSAPVGGLITGPILQVHTVNYQQATDYIAIAGCGVVTNTGNAPPVVIMPSNFTIPKSTPFALTGSATDANGDALTYCWEGTNIGTVVPTATTLADKSKAPFFRSYEPNVSPTRIYPLLDAILDGSNYAVGDKLPSVGIATTHNLTVRDNNSAGGGVSFGSVTITVNGSIGPFLETTNLSGSYTGGSARTITWSVNGTNSATPNVKISLSTDGGHTFPTVLAASSPNDGSESVTLPNISTTTARIKVEAVGNIFFDISNSNFSITAAGPTFTITASAGAGGSISPSGAVSVASGANKTFTITPNPGFTVQDVLVDAASIGAFTTYTFNNVTADHSISATFAPTSGCTKPVLSAVITNVKCNGGSNGAINLSVTGGTAPFTYAWRFPGPATATTQDISGLVAGNYYVVVTATGGCKDSAKYVVTQPSVLKVSVLSKTNVSCKGGNDGSITVKATGGSSPYTYRINTNFQSSPTFGNRAKGTYSITVKDKNGCTAVVSNIVIKDGTGKCAGAALGITEASKPTTGETSLTAEVYPNPGKAEFTLKLRGNSNEQVQLKVIDMYGRPVYQTRGSASQVYKFGQHFIPGTYLIQVLQGSKLNTVKVIKE